MAVQSTIGRIDEIDPRFLQLIATALVTWQAIENSLVLLYGDLSQIPDKVTASITIHAARDFKTKLDITSAIIVHHIKDKKLKDDWQRVRETLISCSGRRNDLIHGTVVAVGSNRDPNKWRFGVVKGPLDPRTKVSNGNVYRNFDDQNRLKKLIADFESAFRAVREFYNQALKRTPSLRKLSVQGLAKRGYRNPPTKERPIPVKHFLPPRSSAP